MGLAADVKVLYHLLLKPVRGRDHAERMESFYAGQADDYDAFRQRLLQGREELCQHLQFPDDAIWVDLGGGTGSNLEFVADLIPRLRKVYVVDLSPSLLDRAEVRRDSAAGRTSNPWPRTPRPSPLPKVAPMW